MNKLLALLVLLFSGNAVFADFNLDFGSGLPFDQTFGQLTYLGEATSNFSEGLVRLVPSANDKVGVVWHRSKQQIVNGFSTTFGYAMDKGTQSLGGDGMAFVIQNISPFSAGFFRSGLGYTGISNSIAVEFDTIQNQSDLRDPNAGHIGINSRGKLSNTADHDLATLSITGAFPNQTLPLNDGNSRYVRVDYEPGFMTVYWDDATRPTTGAEVDLSQLLNVPEGNAFVGFTAATGLGNLGKQEVDIFN